MRNQESRLDEEKKNLRNALDDAENRATRLELARRSAEGELQRMKLALNDKDTENQVSCLPWLMLVRGVKSLLILSRYQFLYKTLSQKKETICFMSFKAVG